MNLRLYFTALAVASVALVFAPIAPSAPAAKSGPSALTTPVTGTAVDGSTLTGVLSITDVIVQNGQLVAVGTLTATLTDALGNVIATVTQAVTVPLEVSGSCTILHLDIGPISLNVLGLQVTTNEIIIDVTAQSGPGQLVGNLVCAVSHLLDNPSTTLQGIASLLNAILGAL
jgi:hypothetical protein